MRVHDFGLEDYSVTSCSTALRCTAISFLLYSGFRQCITFWPRCHSRGSLVAPSVSAIQRLVWFLRSHRFPEHPAIHVCVCFCKKHYIFCISFAKGCSRANAHETERHRKKKAEKQKKNTQIVRRTRDHDLAACTGNGVSFQTNSFRFIVHRNRFRDAKNIEVS